MFFIVDQKSCGLGSNMIIYRCSMYFVAMVMCLHGSSCVWYAEACFNFKEELGSNGSIPCRNASWAKNDHFDLHLGM